MLCGAKVHSTAHPAAPGRSGSLHALPQGPQPSRRAWLALVAVAAGGWVPRRVARAAAKRLKENSDLRKVIGIWDWGVGFHQTCLLICFDGFWSKQNDQNDKFKFPGNHFDEWSLYIRYTTLQMLFGFVAMCRVLVGFHMLGSGWRIYCWAVLLSISLANWEQNCLFSRNDIFWLSATLCYWGCMLGSFSMTFIIFLYS